MYQVYQLIPNRKHLLDNLTNSCITPQWRAEDILRTKVRLSLVLSAAGEEKGASERRQEIKTRIKKKIDFEEINAKILEAIDIVNIFLVGILRFWCY